MDDITDNQIRERSVQNVSKLIESKRLQTDPFGENKLGARIYRRAERLTIAMYLITNHIPSDEPIRRFIRDGGIRFLGEVLDVRSEMRAAQSTKVQALKATVRELVSLMRLLAVSGFSSVQNTEIMIEALDDLGNFINVSERSILSEGVKITREDVADIPIKDRIVLTDTNNVKDKQGIRENVQYNAVRKSTRADSILETLRAGGIFGIKDIAVNFPEYSEKMIQRDLAELVNRGVVRKIGFKRWSRYTFIELPQKGVVTPSGNSVTTINTS